MNPSFSMLQRKPVRISITVAEIIHEQLLQRSDCEGRSLSNLASYLLERELSREADPPRPPIPKRWGPRDQR